MAANSSEDISALGWQGDAATPLSVTTPGTDPTDVTVDYEIEVAVTGGRAI
jgi:hypothetical protein